MPTPQTDNIIPFNFQEVRLQEACWIDGKPYYTRRAIGEFLEYTRPQEDIDKLIRRNPHISTFGKKVILTLPEQLPVHPNLGCTQEVRYQTHENEIYDPIGLQLIVNKSNQPKAIKLQVAVAKLVWAYLNGELLPSRWSQKGDIAAIRQILSAPGTYGRRKLIVDYAEREGISMASAYRRIGNVDRLKTLSGQPRRKRTPSQ